MSILQATELHKSFGKGEKRVLAVNGVSLSLNAGEILAFLGPNGAGKTTTIKMIAGLVEPDAGTVRIDGLNPQTERSVFAHIGMVLEGTRNLYLQLTCRENLEYFGNLKNMSRDAASRRAGELLKQFNLSEKEFSRVRDLSRGMQQKLAIAVALIHSPRLLLMDEPTNGVDVEAAEEIKTLMRKLVADGMAILLTTHQLDVAQAVADRVVIIRKGEIVCEETTAGLIKRFAGDSYTIVFEGLLAVPQLMHIERAGGDVVDGKITYRGDSEGLYEILATLRPNPIVSVNKGDNDLTCIFLKLVKEGDHA